ncbi:hypothetical protein [Frankia sp. Cppng1_Ct_nod]|uniref:hypothetical protein n=1 Tax=Frankia sp. Cppng1_Ct_nod TaxID=2897162 RepID=UPI0010412F94|nr:hypothetical protein [Frankia sp. Cppng1_Ct_nod]
MSSAAPRPLAEEAALLGAALRDLLTDPAAHASQGHADTRPAGAPVISPMTTCQVCPVCRLVATLAAGRPEVAAHLFTAATSLAAALRAALAGPAGADEDDAATDGTGGTCRPENTTERPRSRSRVQRIDVE